MRSRENSASRLCSLRWALPVCWTGGLLLRGALQLLADGGQAQAALGEDLGGEALLLAQQAEQEVFGADVLVGEALGLLGGVGEHALALVGEREVDRGGDLLADGGVALDLLADGLDRGVRAQEAVGERLVLAQQAEQQVLGLDVRRTELAGLVAGKEDDSSRLLGIAFEHISPSSRGSSIRPKAAMQRH